MDVAPHRLPAFTMFTNSKQAGSHWRTVQMSLMTMVVCAWTYSTIFRESFSEDLIYAFFVVTITQAMIAAGRYAWMRYVNRNRAAAGERSEIGEAGALRWPGWKWMAPWVIFCVIVGYFVGVRVGNLIIGNPKVALTMTERTRMISLSIAVAMVPALFITFYYYSKSHIAAIELRAQTALRSAVESQLKLLESQLEPHMLFNTLANLRVLMADDPERAQGMLDRLIAYLRATLDASRAGMHSLQAEFDRLSDYLALMAVRMGSRLHFELHLPPELADLSCPPFLLQPLVENAIKHGLEPQVRGGRIVVTAERDGGLLVLQVRDTGAGLDAHGEHGTRFGLQQVRERLGALYGASGSVVLQRASDEEGGTLAVISLPYLEDRS